jgi:uncharacterized protein (DUF1330 family)
MPKALWVAQYRSVSNPERLADYAKLALPAIVAGGGRFLARGIPVATKEKGLSQRTVVVEFDSVAQALAVYDSPAYQEALKALGPDSAERDIRVMEMAE